MKALDLKLIRDLLEMKGQMLAICLVIGCGVATFVMSFNTLESLEKSKADYYRDYRFADIFAGIVRAPRSIQNRIAAISGVNQVETRVVMQANLSVEGMDEPAVGRLISIPDRNEPLLNALHIRRGRMIENGRIREVVVSEAFADAHEFEPGDEIEAILNGSKEKLKIVGIAISPEYIYQLQGGSILPDDLHFGVFWMGYEELSSAFDMEGGFNDVSLTLTMEASEPDVIRQLDQILKNYGGLGAHSREEQVSNRFISDEIKNLKGTGLVVPSIFLAVAGFLLNVVMTRLISTQREQIAALKAFGYSNVEVGIHYLKLTLLISLIGAFIGTFVGMQLGKGMTGMYADFYRFPVFDFVVNWKVVMAAILVAIISGTLSVLSAVLHAVKLPAAEAMRPEPPATFRQTLIERMGLQRYLPQTARMIIRQIARKPLKTLLSCMGIGIATSILVLGQSMYDAMDFMIDHQFFLTQRQDMTISYVEPRSNAVGHEVVQLPGVLFAEPFRTVPVKLIHRNHSKRIALIGLKKDGELFRLLDDSIQQVPLPGAGLLLSKKLADLLSIETGDFLTAEVLEGKKPVLQVQIADTTEGYTGIGAYMQLDALNRLMKEGPVNSGAYLKTDPELSANLYRQLKEIPMVAGVTIKRTMLKSFHDTIQQNMTTMNVFNVLFACIIACGVVYNIARISLSESSRELATLRVIGFTRFEISSILLGELTLITLFAIPFGLGLGCAISWLVSLAYNTELFRIPFALERSTFGFATMVVILATLVSSLIVRKKLDNLDLVSVLKSKD